MMTFMWPERGYRYQFDARACRKGTGIIQLPDGTLLRVWSWQDTGPGKEPIPLELRKCGPGDITPAYHGEDRSDHSIFDAAKSLNDRFNGPGGYYHWFSVGTGLDTVTGTEVIYVYHDRKYPMQNQVEAWEGYRVMYKPSAPLKPAKL